MNFWLFPVLVLLLCFGLFCLSNAMNLDREDNYSRMAGTFLWSAFWFACAIVAAGFMIR